MQQIVLDAYPEVAVSVFVVWVPMLTADSVTAAEEVAGFITDPRAVHLYDTARRISRGIAASVGGVDSMAWDTYLFYGPGATWMEAPPPPDRWMHQLGPSMWADPNRFRWAESLKRELQAAAVELLGMPTLEPP